MTKTRALLAIAAVLACTATAPALAADGDSAVLAVSRTGKQGLRGITISGLRWPARSVSVAGGVGTVELSGTLRFRAGQRTISASGLRITAGSTSSTLSGKLAGARVSLFAARGRPVIGASSVSLNAKAALTPAAAAKLKRALKLKRAPSTATLGTLKLTASDTPVAPAPVAATPIPIAAAPTPTSTPPPASCAERFAATPAGSADWFSCDLPGLGDLKSWTNYIERPFPPACGSGAGTVVASGGASELDTPYDHRFAVASFDRHTDGSITLTLSGSVEYTMPAHGIEELIGNLRIEINGLHGQVFADGTSNPRDTTVCPGAAQPYSDEHVLDLDLTGITPTTADGVTRWIDVPAKIAAGATVVGGGVYGDGAAWGEFTIAVPA